MTAGATGRKRWLARYRGALVEPDLRRLLGGLLISMTGSWAYNVALLAYVYARTHSLGWVSAAGFVRFVPPLVLSTPAGVLAERTERVRLMAGSDLLCGLWQTCLAVVALSGGPVGVALAFAALTAICGVVYPPAVAATIPSVVGEEQLAAANALNATIEQLVVIAGPGIGALLLLVSSAGTAFAVNAASFLVSAILISRIRTRSRPVDVSDEGDASPLGQLLVGARTIVADHAARTLVAYCALVSFVYGTDTVLFVGVSAHRLGTGPQGFGYLLAGLGVGGILAAGAVDRLSSSPRLSAVILCGALGYTLPTALLVVVHAAWLAFVLQILRGASTLVVDVLAVTVLQRAVAPHQLARVFGVFFAFVLGAILLGTLITPVIVSAGGLNAGLWTMALAPAAVALAGFPALRGIDRRAALRIAELEPRVRLLETLGLFSGASRPILERLAGAATVQEFAPAAGIVAEGEPADALYVLADGEVQVSARGERGGEDRPIRVMPAPSFFGEIGLLEGIPRTATVRARTPCRCYRIAGDAVLQALTASPPSSSLMENARTRLAVTHPSRRLTYSPDAAEPVEAAGSAG